MKFGKYGVFTFTDVLGPADLAELWRECRFSDMQSATLIEAYLDSLHPDWREDQRYSNSGAYADGAEPSQGGMTRDEAFDILGVKPDATEEEIRTAHRELMMKLHPDRGGSGYLAARINMAKDVLLNG